MTIELVLNDSMLSRHEVVKAQVGEVVILSNGMVGTVVNIFEKRMGDESQTLRIGPTSLVETNLRMANAGLVLLTVSSLRSRGEGLKKRGTLSWHDDGSWWKSCDGDCQTNHVSLYCPIQTDLPSTT